MVHLPIQEPQGNIASQGPVATGQCIQMRSSDGLNTVWICRGSGAPTNGTSGDGAGWITPGSLYVDAVNSKLYQNTGTAASPVWTVFESSGGNVLFPTNAALTAHSGGGKASALALANGLNQIATAAADNDSVLLPASTGGNFAVVTNNGASGVAAYGAGTDTINGALTTAAYYIPAGQTVVFWSQATGTWSAPIATTGAVSESQPSAPTAPASTSTYFMQGLAGATTPKKSGTILVMIRGNLIGSSTTAGDGILLEGSYGTGAAPANAAALAGTQKGAALEYTNPATVTAVDINVPFSLTYVITGAVIDTALWLDLAAKSVGTASHVGLANVDITAVEL